MWAGKKGTGVYTTICAENCQILAIVDWPLIGVDSFETLMRRIKNMICILFEGYQHQSVTNQQLPKSVDSLHKMSNGSCGSRGRIVL